MAAGSGKATRGKTAGRAESNGDGGAVSGTVVTREQAAAGPEEDARQVQAVAEGVAPVVEGQPDRRRQVEFMGRWFRVADKVGLIPLMKFAHASADDLDTSSLDALAAMYEMLRDCIHQGAECTCGAGWVEKYPDPDNPGQQTGGRPDWRMSRANVHEDGCAWDPGDWHEFERHATATKADAEDVLPITRKVMELLTARPT